MKISKPLQKALDEIAQSDSPWLKMNPQALLLHQWAETEQMPSDPFDVDVLLRQGLYAECTEAQWRLVRFKFPDLLVLNEVAAYRRITGDLPLEYAVLMSLSARSEWITAKINWRYERETLWGPLLLAAASHDCLATQRLVDHWKVWTDKPDNPALVPMTEAIVALIENNPAELSAATDKFRTSVGSYLKGLQAALVGIANNHPANFSDGMQQMLKQFRGYLFNEKTSALINPHALGLFELARVFSPECAAAFDAQQGLPWDAEYSEAIRNLSDIQPELDQLDLPEDLRKPLISMEALDWPPDNRPKK